MSRELVCDHIEGPCDVLNISSEMLFRLYLVEFALIIVDIGVELSVLIKMTESLLSITRSANQIVISSFILVENQLKSVIEVYNFPLYRFLLIRNPHSALDVPEVQHCV